MTSAPKPTDINLHQQSRILEVKFEDGSHFELPCEYLRVYSPSAEVQGHGPGQEVLQVGKENVNITSIEPVGNYAIKLEFDDGHNTGIYSWDTLYVLGRDKEANWAEYLERLEKAGHKRKT
ncbi:gamma-butyrobetaine hydroxylase-like domain-containing protein [Kaarinaea lacus]